MTHKTFPGGVHPPDRKELSKAAAVVDLPAPGTLVVPLAQHIGRPAAATVKVTDRVLRGQRIGEAQGFVSAHVHSPVSGTVKRIVECNTPIGGVCQGLLIENDGEDTWAEGCNVEEDTAGLDAEAVRARVADAGLVGLGGATFPTHVKLSPPEAKPINVVLLNGVECEPYLTADYRLMLESPETVLEGLLLVMTAVGCSRGVIGIEANKPDAFERFRALCAERSGGGRTLEAVLLEVKYPQGGEKQLIQAALGREVPSGGLPMDVGVVVQNVGTAHAVFEACRHRRPLTERIVTISGEGVDAPQNLRVRVGTPIRALLDAAGYSPERTRKLILGGPMMGNAHFDLDLPVTKGTSGVLALTDADDETYRACIRCGRCVECCPARLIPSELSILAESGRFADAGEANLLDCIECGGCTYICPARRPIVQWIRLAKAELRRAQQREAERQRAEEAEQERAATALVAGKATDAAGKNEGSDADAEDDKAAADDGAAGGDAS